MDYAKEIKKEFDLFVKQKFTKIDIQNFLLNHERIPLLINNLVKEIKGAEHVIFGGGKTPEEKREIVAGLAKDLSNMFCSQALEVKSKELGGKSKQSFAAKIMRL